MGKKYSIDETTLNELGDIIRKNTGTTGKVEFDDIKSQVESGGSGDGSDVDELWEQICNRSFTEVGNSAVTTITAFAFSECFNLTTANFPACIYIGYGGFFWCSSLTTVNLPVCTYIGTRTFFDCSSLTSLYLPGHAVCTLDNPSAFLSTPFDEGIGNIYVPASLVDAYKSAPNWVYFSSLITAIPE